MENMEKVDLLRERADVSYEEAKAVLEEAGWDLLDAIVILERRGKTKAPRQESFSTSYDEQEQYEKVKEKVEEQQKKAERNGNLRQTIRRICQILVHNSFQIQRKNNILLMMPAWVFALILFVAWKGVVPAMIIGLFFGFRYSFEGEDDLKTANDFMDKASDVVNEMKSEFDNK
ncbi:MAG: hypothetical protein IIZ39_03160 [Blautia sp.]|nr:hypothetical protein [Blautia sp.]